MREVTASITFNLEGMKTSVDNTISSLLTFVKEQDDKNLRTFKIEIRSMATDKVIEKITGERIKEG